MTTAATFPIPDVSAVAGARRAGERLAERLGFSAERAGRVALIVSELAQNLARHARNGHILLRALGLPGRDDEASGVEVVALDTGPGMKDVAWARTDGHSTTGTLGQGLGAVGRLSDFSQIYTHDSGSIVMARLAREAAPPSRSHPLHEIGAVFVSKPGESVCGDDAGWRRGPERLAVLVADGLGHGLPAHDASSLAVKLFTRVPDEAPQRTVTEIHEGLRSTRGAAVACLALDSARGVVQFCGLGNISAVALHRGGGRHSFVCQNGIAGHVAPRIQEFTYPVPRGSVLVMHSDGVRANWDLSRYPGLLTRHPSVIAALLYRDFGRGRDDVSVVVIKERQG